PKLIEAYEKRGDTLGEKYRETARKAVELIKQSPSSGTVENHAFLMATCWLRQLYERVYRDELGEYATDQGVKRLSLTNGMLLLAMIYRPDLELHLDPYEQIESFIDDFRTPHRETKDEMVMLALQDALDYMLDNYGRVDVRWGDVEKFVRGGVKFERAGAFQWAGAMLRKDGPEAGFGFPKRYNPLYRLVVEVGKKPEAISITLAGQSGNPDNPHYLDQTRLSVQDKHKRLHFAWKDVLAHEESRQIVERKR
ncbi:MAG: penicillin acylase family protein, partial [bacterium]|nr:penicillin acylase family protein [bacterium]